MNKTPKQFYLTVECPQCAALAIQGTACHETGCPLSKRRWVKRGTKLVPSEVEGRDNE